MKILSILSALMLGLAFQAYAQGAMMEGTVKTGVDSDVEVGKTNLKVNTGVQMQAGMRVQENESEEGTTTKKEKESSGMMERNNAAMHKDGEGNDEATTTGDNENDVEFFHGNTISLHAKEMHGWDDQQKEEFLATVKAEAQVKSGQDLENFAKGVLLKDENVASIDVNEGETHVEYNMPAKMFGMFDASLNAQISADATGKVKVKYPWYSFLFKKAVSSSDLETKVNASLPNATSTAQVGFKHRAQILLMISNALKLSHEASISS